MGEVGGSFNERKNEITRKSRMCPAKNIVFVYLKEDVLFCIRIHLSRTPCILIFRKRSSHNSKNSNQPRNPNRG